MICKECGQKKERYVKGLCKACYSRLWRINHPEEYEKNKVIMREITRKYRLEHPEKKKEWAKNYYEKHKDEINEKRKKEHDKTRIRKFSNRKKICKMLKEHHELMINDQEHLTTEFMQNIIGIKCKKEEEK